MQVFLYKLDKDKLVPSKDGDIIVIVDKDNVKVFDNKGNEITNYNFSFLGDEYVLLEKLHELEKVVNIKVNVNYALAYPDISSRKLRVNQIIGYLFEEYVYSLLSRYYRVERNKEIFISLSKFGFKSHNKPDFIVENKIAIEAKVGDYSVSQIIDYEKRFKIGAIVFPWSGNCKTRKWRCFYYVIKDSKPLIDWIGIYLNK
ncbi:hypothetical protein SJAV_06510 [Sulfurisphaera javensis]|uniref:Uncharacterized protein n=1 Tax=Sulfurisphaera javensis TaxID=2049879 RepID=A0AAT9GPF5_9CREN